MERVSFITHDGREILLLDFSGTKPSDAMAIIEHAMDVISSRPENSLLTLTDVTDIRFNDDLSRKMKEFTVHNKPCVKAAAVVGVTGLKRIIFNAVIAFSRRNLTTFGDRETAKRWLAKQ